jgi:hypothetical protein
MSRRSSGSSLQQLRLEGLVSLQLVGGPGSGHESMDGRDPVFSDQRADGLEERERPEAVSKDRERLVEKRKHRRHEALDEDR